MVSAAPHAADTKKKANGCGAPRRAQKFLCASRQGFVLGLGSCRWLSETLTGGRLKLTHILPNAAEQLFVTECLSNEAK